MVVHFIEATDATEFNWGKFMLMRFDSEWAYRSVIDANNGLISGRGWSRNHMIVFDLETGEGAIFSPRDNGCSDLDLNNKHKIWVCPMFQPFLKWLYEQDVTDITKLPAMVNLGDVPTEMFGHRRAGKECGKDEGVQCP